LDVISWIENKTEVKKAGQIEKSEYNTIKELYEIVLKENKCTMHGVFVSRSDLIEAIREELNVSEGTADRKIKELINKSKAEKFKEGRGIYIRIL